MLSEAALALWHLCLRLVLAVAALAYCAAVRSEVWRLAPCVGTLLLDCRHSSPLAEELKAEDHLSSLVAHHPIQRGS
jgi:hypothetical protein